MVNKVVAVLQNPVSGQLSYKSPKTLARLSISRISAGIDVPGNTRIVIEFINEYAGDKEKKIYREMLVRALNTYNRKYPQIFFDLKVNPQKTPKDKTVFLRRL